MSKLRQLRALAQPIYDQYHPEYPDFLPRLLLPVINVEPTPVQDDDLPVGVSKIGGWPDLGAQGWPLTNGQPQFFVAQFNLTDLKPYDEDQLLPEVGLLSFFLSESAISSMKTDPAFWTVRYVPDLRDVQRAAPPVEGYEVHEFATPAHQLRFQVGIHPWGDVVLPVEDGTWQSLHYHRLFNDPAWREVTRDAGDVPEEVYLLGDAHISAINGTALHVEPHETAVLTLPGTSTVLPFVTGGYGESVSFAFVIPREELRAGDFSRVQLQYSITG